MAEVDAFGKVLYETISSNKLSASRVDRVKSYAVRCFHESSMLVKMIVKCHKKASKSTKVSSLYLFDAVARHARDVVRKKGQGFDPSGARAPKNDSTIEPGTTEALVAGAKAFLSTAQLAAQELCIDTMATVSQEQKEKVKKVIDIWGKANTFDASFLSKLQASLASSISNSAADNNEAERSTTPLVEPISAEAGPSSRPLDGPADANALLESLSGVLQGLKGGNNGTTPSASRPASQPNFDLSQLSVLQQLAAASTSAPHQVASMLTASPPPPPSLPFSSILPGPPAYLPPQPTTLSTHPGRRRSQSPQSTRQPPNSVPRNSNPPHTQESYRHRLPPDSITDTVQTGMTSNNGGPDQSQQTLADFDMTSFDPTQPSQWQSLAVMWKNTYGYMPSNQELMMCMMMGGFPPLPGQTLNGHTSNQSHAT